MVLKTRLKNKTSHFTNSTIIDPKLVTVKQYLYAINNTILAKLKNIFLYYSTSSTIKDLLKASFPTNQQEGFLKIDTFCFELSHSIESSLRSLSTM